jgi:hypothetical protein
VTEHRDEDLSGSTFERVSLRGSTFRKVDLRDVDIRGALFEGARLRGVELVDVDIHGELHHVVVNGVDIGPLVEAELDRRMPDRARMRPGDADGFRTAWSILEGLWDTTIERARALPEASLHERVNGEWSFIQTVRHLGFATAAWVGRVVLGNPTPWHPLDLPWDEAPGWEGIPWDRDVQPSLDDVLALRRERRAMVRDVLATLTDEQLATTVTRTEPGWPRVRDFPFGQGLRIVINEEWEHRLYAARDLDVLEAASTSG